MADCAARAASSPLPDPGKGARVDVRQGGDETVRAQVPRLQREGIARAVYRNGSSAVSSSSLHAVGLTGGVLDALDGPSSIRRRSAAALTPFDRVLRDVVGEERERGRARAGRYQLETASSPAG